MVRNMSCHYNFEGQPLKWQGECPSKNSHAILRQALLSPEKDKDEAIFSLNDKRLVRGSDPLLGASNQCDLTERRLKKRRLPESSILDMSGGVSGSKFKSISAEKMLFESATDLIQDEIHPEMEAANQLPGDSTEYTSHLLSQLSSSSLLPTMTSSQVSSVLSALEPNTVTQAVIPSTTSAVRTKCVDNWSTSTSTDLDQLQNEFIKQYSTNLTIVHELSPNVDSIEPDKPKRKRTVCLATKAIVRYCIWLHCRRCYTENSIKGNVWYQCSCCSFISINRATIVQHCIMSHDGIPFNSKTNSQPVCKCLACDNLFCSLQSLKVHYLCDHNATNEDIEDLLKLTIEVSKCLKTSSTFTQTKPFIPLVEKDMTGHQGHEQQTAETINRSNTSVYPLFDDNQSTNQVATGPSEPPRVTSTTHDTSVLQSSNISIPTISSAQTEDLSSNQNLSVNIKIHQDSSPQKSKDPALKKFRDLKLEKVGGKKCGLGGCAIRFGAVSNLEYHKKCHHRKPILHI